jgi:large subunit ribosomal protein L14
VIQQQTILKVSDNSGVKTVKCIKVLNGFKKKYATIGDTIVVSIQTLRNRSTNTVFKVKKKEVCRALIVRAKTLIRNKDGFAIQFNENSAVLVNKQSNPVGTRIIGPLSNLLKKQRLRKFISISSGLI